MIVLGINAHHADSSAAILVDGQLGASAVEERFEGVQHWAGFPKRAVEHCLTAAGARVEDIDHVAYAHNARAHVIAKLLYLMKERPVDFIKERAAVVLRARKHRNEIAAALGVDPERLRARRHDVERHRALLASAYYASPFEESAVLSAGTLGDFVGAMWANGQKNRLDVLKRVAFPHALDMFLAAMAQYLGFPRFGDERELAAMAVRGQADERTLHKVRRLVRLTDDGGFELGLEYFQHHTGSFALKFSTSDGAGEPHYDRVYSDRLIELLGPPREPGQPEDERALAIAASTLKRYDEVCSHMLTAAARLTGSRNVCVAGGCAPGCAAKGKALLRGQFDDVFIPPGPPEAGTAAGAALYTYHHVLGHPRR